MTTALIVISLIGAMSLIFGIIYIIKRIRLGHDYVDEGLFSGILFWVFGVIWFITLISTVHLSASEQLVSGIVYNNKNNGAFTGNTYFSVRADVDTYVSEENQSSYCLPPNSPYKELVNKAAENKDIKVVVTTSKFFKFAAPWTCVDNVTVTIKGDK